MPSASNKQNIVPSEHTQLISGSLADIESIDRVIRTRRKLWLEKNPDYLDSLSINLQLTGKALYAVFIQVLSLFSSLFKILCR